MRIDVRPSIGVTVDVYHQPLIVHPLLFCASFFVSFLLFSSI